MKNISMLALVLFSMLLGAGKVAITVKTSGAVNHIHADGSPATPLKLGVGLADEDIIQTGLDGFAVAMYLDDKTAIKIRENSEFLIGGTKSETGINKRVALNYGTMAASVSKQKGKEFIIATPTSVASVKGTDIIIISDPALGDMFITLVGSIVVTNSTTGDSTTVDAGETATSTADGGLDVTTTDEDDVPDFDEDGETGGESHELRFEIEDPDGNLKEVIIQYQ